MKMKVIWPPIVSDRFHPKKVAVTPDAVNVHVPNSSWSQLLLLLFRMRRPGRPHRSRDTHVRTRAWLCLRLLSAATQPATSPGGRHCSPVRVQASYYIMSTQRKPTTPEKQLASSLPVSRICLYASRRAGFLARSGLRIGGASAASASQPALYYVLWPHSLHQHPTDPYVLCIVKSAYYEIYIMKYI
jgi:hypothetical protein